MKVHVLKTWPEFFAAVADETKTFEVRRNDRSFQVGDRLRLREWNPEHEAYTGQECFADISYILTGEQAEQFGIQPGFCVMGFERPHSHRQVYKACEGCKFLRFLDNAEAKCEKDHKVWFQVPQSYDDDHWGWRRCDDATCKSFRGKMSSYPEP